VGVAKVGADVKSHSPVAIIRIAVDFCMLLILKFSRVRDDQSLASTE
jgi:hypothetical protein